MASAIVPKPQWTAAHFGHQHDSGRHLEQLPIHARDPEMLEHHVGTILAGSLVFFVVYFGIAVFALTH